MHSRPSPVRDTQFRAVAIQSLSSIGFVQQVFRAYESGLVAVVCPPRKLNPNALLGLDIVEEISPDQAHGWEAFEFSPVRGSDPAHLSFTSGTTGNPKGIILSHDNLQDVTDRLIEVMGLTPEIREYVGVPVNFSFGLGRCRAIATIGGRCYIPALGFNPIQLVDMINSGEVNAISAVPTQWRSFFKAPGLLGAAGRHVRWIEIGSQSMSRAEKEHLKTLFPDARIVQHYGLTEASRTTFLNITDAQGHQLESVGRTIGDSEIALSDDGRIRIRGPHVGLGELRDGTIHPLVDEDGWLQTNDLGTISNGDLYYGGRADDLINCGGTKISCEQFERELIQELGIEGGIAVGPIADEMRGHLILVASDSTAYQHQSRVESAAQSVAARFGLSGAVVRFARCEEIPRTPTGKVKRKELATFFEERSPAPTGGEIQPAASSQDLGAHSAHVKDQLISVWQNVLSLKSVPTDRSFFELGGDSLSAMAVLLQIERLNVPANIARKVFEGKTLQQIIDELEGRDSQVSGGQVAVALGSRVINATRGLLVLLVIAVHWLPGVWARLPSAFSRMDSYLHPIYRLGTPGFALVFGIGWGYFQIPLYRSNPGRYLMTMRRNAILLFSGILLMAGVRAGVILLSPKDVARPDIIVSSFFSVLTYYFLVVLAGPILLLPLVRSSAVISTSLLMSMLALSGNILATILVNPNQVRGFPELVRLMLIAKYNIFAMSGIVFLGTAVGVAYRRAADSDGLARLPLVRLGIGIAGFGVITSYQTVGLASWMSANGQEPWALATYTGIVMLICGVIQWALTATNSPSYTPSLIDGLAVIGMLAFPAFILHEVVIPMKDILVQLGVPAAPALLIPLASFLAIMGFLYYRLKRVYSVSS